jgi:hypothetical protein
MDLQNLLEELEAKVATVDTQVSSFKDEIDT